MTQNLHAINDKNIFKENNNLLKQNFIYLEINEFLKCCF